MDIVVAVEEIGMDGGIADYKNCHINIVGWEDN